jgi:hypothetical protein
MERLVEDPHREQAREDAGSISGVLQLPVIEILRDDTVSRSYRFVICFASLS